MEKSLKTQGLLWDLYGTMKNNGRIMGSIGL
jgi:hypothetical protein